MRAGREGEGDRCVYVPLVAPPTEARTDACDIDFGKGRDGDKGKSADKGWRARKENAM